MSNLEMYKYNWVWVKDNATNFLNKPYQAGKIMSKYFRFPEGKYNSYALEEVESSGEKKRPYGFKNSFNSSLITPA